MPKVEVNYRDHDNKPHTVTGVYVFCHFDGLHVTNEDKDERTVIPYHMVDLICCEDLLF